MNVYTLLCSFLVTLVLAKTDNFQIDLRLLFLNEEDISKPEQTNKVKGVLVECRISK